MVTGLVGDDGVVVFVEGFVVVVVLEKVKEKVKVLMEFWSLC